MKRGLAVALVSTLACSGNTADTPVESREQAIIRGTLVQSEELDHTGAPVIVDPDTEQRSVFCTATLIGPEVVVTAKHCALTIFDAESLGLPVEWLAGPSVAEPVEQIPVAAVALEPVNEGGFLGIGRDVGVVLLDRPASVAAAEPALIGDEHVGQAMLSIGYGIFTPNGARDGRRRVGTEAVEAIRGRAFEDMFGSFENFVEWNLTGNVTSANFLAGFGPGDLRLALLLPGFRAEYEGALLLDGYEAVTGRSPGDTQTCSGDSGGPLAQREDDGTWKTYGVVSGGVFSAQSICDYGSVFAVFGSETLAFLERARSLPDPCGAVSAQGECQGALAVRCQTALLDGVRRLIERDCGAIGQTCSLQSSGSADCTNLDESVGGTDAGAQGADAGG
jgi:hypothetical protein